ncbi:MAG: hypothetical protein Q8O91_01310 [Candidatus Aminicenantes bacterium]|nr:hypothetical protein [Candidatus Aminicenantes bacterium]
MKKILVIVFLVGIILAASILGFSQKIESKARIRVVHNEKGGTWGANPAVALTLVRTLGEIPLDHFVSAVRIFKDSLFLIDVERWAKIYHYKIIDK